MAVDVHYPPGGGAHAAAVVAADLAFATIVEARAVDVAEAGAYQAGSFYTRELPALRAVLAEVGSIDLLVVDGYVQLDPQGRAGLGAYAHAAFGVPVIGVAKSAFRTATHAIVVLRGTAIRPLYVTAAGIDPVEAAAIVKAMAGRYRLPDALRRVDALSRGRQWPADQSSAATSDSGTKPGSHRSTTER